MDLSSFYPTFWVGFLATLIVSLLLVLTKQWHGKHSLDESHGIQKMHQAPTPRVGGLAIALGFVAVGFVIPPALRSLWVYIGCAGALAFGFGLAEDITKKVRVKWRLLATMGSGLVFALLSGYSISSIDIWWFDYALSITLFGLAFTAFAISGAANAINIIDGFHGLSSGSLMIILMSIAFVGWQVGDTDITVFALTMAAIVAGFWLINFPFGLLFLGDAGAYFAGYIVAVLVVMLPTKHPEISPWISLLILGYPVTETLASVFRRWRSDASAGDPDSQHLHHLVHRQLSTPLALKLGMSRYTNAITGAIMWLLPFFVFWLVAQSSFDTKSATLRLAIVIGVYTVIYAVFRRRDKISVTSV